MVLAVTTHITCYYTNMTLSIDRSYFSKYHNRLVFVKEMDDVYCQERIDILYVTSTGSLVRSRRATARAIARPSKQKTLF